MISTKQTNRRPLIAEPLPSRERLMAICEAVARHHGFSSANISPRRHMHNVVARAGMAWAIRQLTGMSYPQIAHALKVNDASTIRWRCGKYEEITTLAQRTRLLLVCAWWPEVYVPVNRRFLGAT